ncbi:glycosyltransferase [Candidatus Woesearchaeota archaeon]|nr:glycosyltransferase [Nanoarchaeota archaeon]MCB9370425.1 glycosyltransferase [Candidatus Woesearchaeota archaeon]USN43503.1 MAG: glycosyltransferase [Candidatus Woesearchaeota archaeon]
MAGQKEHTEPKPSVYIGVAVNKTKIYCSILSRQIPAANEEVSFGKKNVEEVIFDWIESYLKKNKFRCVALEIEGNKKKFEKLATKIWLELDIIPFITKRKEVISQCSLLSQELAKQLMQRFDEFDHIIVRLGKYNEVEVTDLVDKRYVEEHENKGTLEDVKRYAQALKGKKIVFINSTPRGGGVALMRHALIRTMRMFGINASWHTKKADQEIFEITKKKFHNILQNVAPKNVELTLEEISKFRKWSEDNAQMFGPLIHQADIVVIDDPQPSGLIPWIKGINPTCKVIYRSHIQIESTLATKENSPQYKTWHFISSNLELADLYISHPMLEFIPSNVAKSKTVLMPATTDPYDGLNKDLSSEQMAYYYSVFNKLQREHAEEELDTTREYLIQVARFDPSKGIPDLLKSYALLRKKLKKEKCSIPQLVIAGHSSIDDPDRERIYTETKTLLSTKYKAFQKDVKVSLLPPSDRILNTLLRGAKLALQLSHKEGFEVKVTESLAKGVPVVVSASGGLPLQVKDGETGFIVGTGNCELVAQRMYELLKDEKLYKKISTNAKQLLNKEYFTLHNMLCWEFLFLEMLNNPHFTGDQKSVKELIETKKMEGTVREGAAMSEDLRLTSPQRTPKYKAGGSFP